MNADQKLERIKEIMDNVDFTISSKNIDSEDSVAEEDYILPDAKQRNEITEGGQVYLEKKLLGIGIKKRLDDCSVKIRIEKNIMRASIIHDGVTIIEHMPLEAVDDTVSFELTGISVPFTLGRG